MNKRKGISLIVLVITILVMIILAGVVVVSLQKNNPIEKAKEANFKTTAVTYLEELNMTLLEEEYVSLKKVINKTGDLKEYIQDFKKEDEGKFAIHNNKLCYTGNSVSEELQAIEIGILPYGKRNVVYEYILQGEEQNIDGNIGKVFSFGKYIDVKDRFEITFEAKPLQTTELENIGNLNNYVPGQNTLFHPSYKDENNYVGVGINLGTNGINIIEHSNAYYPFKLINKVDLSERHKYRLIVYDKTYYLYIDDVLVSKEKTDKNLMFKVSSAGDGTYGKYKGMLYNIKISTI